MVIMDYLRRNARLYGAEVSLVELNPEHEKAPQPPFTEYSLVEPSPKGLYRKELTWGAFDEAANRFANHLLASGLKRGEKVALLLMNSIEWLPIYFGALKAGAIVVPLNYRYTADEIRYCLELADVERLVFGPEFVERVAEVKGELARVKEFLYVGEDCPEFAQAYFPAVASAETADPDIALCEDDDAAIYFSSGTTGFPKAILHAHRSLLAACDAEYHHHGQKRGDVFLCIPPLYHTGAKMHWFGSLVSGSRAVLLRGVSPEWIIKAASEEKATIVWLLVPWAQDILDAIDSGKVDISRYSLDQWRLMHIGAQPVPPSLIRRWMKRFPWHQYDTNYGLSESIGPGCVHLGVENVTKVGAIGKAGYGWRTRIVDERGEDVARGEVGELAVAGRGVMKCYYHDPEATSQVLRGEWLFTGDMAREDEDGFIYLVDRKKDVIITGGENLYPVQIEDFLRAMDEIKDVAVIGLPHKRLGEIAAAIIEIKPDKELTREMVDEYCGKLPRYKRPREVIFDKVPRNPTGKIEKPRLRRKYCGDETLVERQIVGD